MEARNKAHSESMSSASPGTWWNVARRWELKLRLMGDSARCSQQTGTTGVVLPGLTSILPHRQSQLNTRWNPSAASGVQLAKKAREYSIFSFVAFLTIKR